MNFLQFFVQKNLRELREHFYNVSYFKLRGGTNQPDSHFTKQKRIIDLQKSFKYDCFIESGTFYGSMISAIKQYFKRVYSVEIYEPLAINNIRYFNTVKNVTVIFGDSATKIEDILNQELNKTFLFWLDGHYSGNGTGIGKEFSPILMELTSILSKDIIEFSIIIDDWRLFDGIDYPSKHDIYNHINSFKVTSFKILEDKDSTKI
jgi:hypothetical protein